MRRHSLLIVATLALACGGKDEPTTSEGGSSSSGAGTTSTSGGSTSSSSGVTSTDASSSSSSSSSTGPACETDASDCGVSVDGTSFCPDPQPAMNELVVEALGPGQIKVSELGHDLDCGLMIDPIVKVYSGNMIYITYMITGQGMDGCVCKATMEATLTGLAAGTWTLYVGPFQQQVDVP